MLSLIAEGGGLRGAYSAGAVVALQENLGLKHVDYATGSSGGICNVAYFVSRQLFMGHDIWVKEVGNHFVKRMNLFTKKPILQKGYIINTVFKKKYPLDVQKIRESTTKLIIPLTNAKTGKTEFFTNHDKEKFFRLLQACISIPFFSAPVRINKNRYYDGVYSCPLPLELPEIKASKKIIILTETQEQDKGRRLEKWISYIFSVRFSKAMRLLIRNYSELRMQFHKDLEKHIKKKDIIIRPKKELPNYSFNSETIKAIYEQGYKDTLDSKPLQKLLKQLKKTHPEYFM
ncbi:hypothetical protein C4573_07055 [Candidatus Woesearchaeota archaeon]|nr:MAG: hypothetical protein C4573_07055 [Candidatus Woesearchaeota archaeon]